jgi:transmembrane sensor
MSQAGTDGPARALDEQAAEWFARMRGPDAKAQRDAFKAWLDVPANRTAYNQIAESFALGRLMIDGRARRRRQLVAAGAALLLVLVAGTWLELRQARLDRPPGSSIVQGGAGTATGTAVLATLAGERRPVRLGDGSLLILAADTTIKAQFNDGMRRLTLKRGQARFEVAHERRPFIVYAGGGTVTARGTIFEVGLAEGRRVSVRLIQGVVDVSLPRAAPGDRGVPPPRRLRAGEAIDFQAADALQPLDPGSGDDTQASTAAGVLDFDRITLAALIDMANRTSARPIRLGDPSLGQRRISGRFRIDDSDLLADRIAALLDLRVERAGTGPVLLRRPRTG